MDLKERFLKYVSYDTQSSEESTTFPSTEKQKVLLEALRDEMQVLGMTEVTMDRYGYVMGTVPASKGYENAPVIGFIAHVDTSPDMSGKDVKPRIVEEYDGGDLVLNGHLTMRVEEFPELAFFKGHTLIHTDGTTLLVTDDNLDTVIPLLKDFAKKMNSIIAVTGAIDLVCDDSRCFVIRNGRAEMSSITGTGCQLSGLMTAYITANPDQKLEAAAAAVCLMGLAGEIAWPRMQEGDGNSTYRNRIIDAICHIDGDTLEKGARYELR